MWHELAAWWQKIEISSSWKSSENVIREPWSPIRFNLFCPVHRIELNRIKREMISEFDRPLKLRTTNLNRKKVFKCPEIQSSWRILPVIRKDGIEYFSYKRCGGFGWMSRNQKSRQSSSSAPETDSQNLIMIRPTSLMVIMATLCKEIFSLVGCLRKRCDW